MPAFYRHFRSSVSHWWATNRGQSSLNSRTNPAQGLPASADTFIAGAGRQGAALASFISRMGAFGYSKSNVVLEAKDVASGATGRSSGHVRVRLLLRAQDIVRCCRPNLTRRLTLSASASSRRL